MASSKQIHRVTMFKVPEQEDMQSILKIYSSMQTDAKKNGKTYIDSLQAGPAMDDPRSQGWNFVVTAKFASKADMDFYDNEDEAHGKLKAVAKGKVQGVMTVYFEDGVSGQ